MSNDFLSKVISWFPAMTILFLEVKVKLDQYVYRFIYHTILMIEIYHTILIS